MIAHQFWHPLFLHLAFNYYPNPAAQIEVDDRNESTPTLVPSGLSSLQPHKLLFRNRVTRTEPLTMSHFYSSPIEIQPAPLATPEAVDFSPAYSLVNDDVHTIIQVNGASPNNTPLFHHYESSADSRSTTSTVSGSSPAPRAVSAEVIRRPRTSLVSLSTDSINRLHQTSNLFQLHPETAMTSEQKQKSLSIESLTKVPEKEKQRNGFVTKVATSFRLRKSLLDTTSDGYGEKRKEQENKKKSSNGGFEQEGLYRVPGNQSHLAEVEKRFLKSVSVKREIVEVRYFKTPSDFARRGEVSSFDTPVHVAATALKSFFSCLPESLIPTDYRSRWRQIMMASDDREKINGIRDALSKLPVANQKVLQYLVKHLTKVSCSPKTVMNSNNLSKVWTPTLFRPVFTSYEELSSGIIAFQLALELLIIHSDSLFMK